MKPSKTELRIKWILENKEQIESSRSVVSPHKGVTVGKNARYFHGMSTGGYGWWARALKQAGINPDQMDYWSGSNSTPSKAINYGIASYIQHHAPKELF